MQVLCCMSESEPALDCCSAWAGMSTLSVHCCVWMYFFFHDLNVGVCAAWLLTVKYVFFSMHPGVVVEAGTGVYRWHCCSGEGDLFISPLSVLSFPHVCASYSLVHHFLRLPPPPLCAPPALLFSQYACHPRGEGCLLPFGQLREAVFAPGFCPAE